MVNQSGPSGRSSGTASGGLRRSAGAQGPALRRRAEMSYRTFKHLLGETSLERKCRFIFGGGILVLVTISFYWYGQKTEKLVIGQTTQTARRLVNPTVVDKHYKSDEFVDSETATDVRPALARASRARTTCRPSRATSSTPTRTPEQGGRRAGDDFEKDALARFLRLGLEGARPIGQQEAVHLRRRHADGGVADPAGQDRVPVHPGGLLQAANASTATRPRRLPAACRTARMSRSRPATSPAPR